MALTISNYIIMYFCPLSTKVITCSTIEQTQRKHTFLFCSIWEVTIPYYSGLWDRVYWTPCMFVGGVLFLLLLQNLSPVNVSTDEDWVLLENYLLFISSWESSFVSDNVRPSCAFLVFFWHHWTVQDSPTVGLLECQFFSKVAMCCSLFYNTLTLSRESVVKE